MTDVIDLSRLDQVSVDLETRRVRVQGGALFSQVDAATRPTAYRAVGLVSHRGVGGLTLGGGIGRLAAGRGSPSTAWCQPRSWSPTAASWCQ